MADEGGRRDADRARAERGARLVLAKHPGVIPSPCGTSQARRLAAPEPSARPARSFDTGTRNINRLLGR